MTISPAPVLTGKDGAVVHNWLPGVQVQHEEVDPLHDTRRDVDVITVEWPLKGVGRSGTGLAHVGPEKVRYSTEEVLSKLVYPPRTRRWSAGKREKYFTTSREHIANGDTDQQVQSLPHRYRGDIVR